MTVDEERNLIERAKEDPNAFGALFDEYYPKIFGYVHRRILDFDIAKDVTSDVFLKAFKSLWRFRWRGISISVWLYRIATNEINYHFRRKTRTPSSLDRLLEESGFELNSAHALFSERVEMGTKVQEYQDFLLIQSKLKSLPLKYQEVIALRYFESKSILEICEILDKKPGTVKSLISRGLERLRRLL
ncbi:sigma-70 family RNA polymerase sigma factor [bacterium]|nr:sigma-70 family RNA polymerase sigma factor [bacterium]